ncbi:hypothetical protein [Saccharothrix longispora]|uniref:hypothetical protein n=1 Tax=Saccharothrix longispora TaxID=33920 RepID=UPI0028FD766E|nr:hypothetical protein [Saccharothrix longispora]MDU0291849.1 hypothetical protein [Saccharothrix longispora]
MVHRKAPVAVVGGSCLLALLLTGACGKPTAVPEPVEVPTVATSSPTAPPSVPAVASISVRPVTTTPPPPTVRATTEAPPPPPVDVPPPPAPEPTAVAPTTTEPGFDEVAIEGFPCEERGATAVDPAGRALVCEPGRRQRLRWERAR